MTILDITPEDISRLSDADLRELVGRLCEEELRSSRAPTSAVRWGGHQDAPDGGLDVEVILPDLHRNSNFVPRAHTGFQVKKSTVPSSTIGKEMRPDGDLRPTI